MLMIQTMSLSLEVEVVLSISLPSSLVQWVDRLVHLHPLELLRSLLLLLLHESHRLFQMPHQCPGRLAMLLL